MSVSPDDNVTVRYFPRRPDRGDAVATQAFDEFPGKRDAQVGTIDDHAPETGAAHRRRERPADRFNFGKFRHMHSITRGYSRGAP